MPLVASLTHEERKCSLKTLPSAVIVMVIIVVVVVVAVAKLFLSDEKSTSAWHFFPEILDFLKLNRIHLIEQLDHLIKIQIICTFCFVFSE